MADRAGRGACGKKRAVKGGLGLGWVPGFWLEFWLGFWLGFLQGGHC